MLKKIAGNILLSTVCICFSPPVSAQVSASDKQTFVPIYDKWTKAFNAKNFDGTLKIFDPTCVASLPDANHKTYAQIKKGFQTLFAEKDKTYSYTYTLHNIYREKSLAAIRITWHLTVSQDGKVLSKNDEHGLDVLKPDKNGDWRIVNWVAYSDQGKPK